MESGLIVLKALDSFNSSQQVLLALPRIVIMSQASYITPDTASASFAPGEQVYALVYVPDLQLSGWVEAVVIGEEAMPGTISIDGTPTSVTFYKVRFGSKGLTDSVSPNHGAVTLKTDAAKAAISAGTRPWIKGI